RDIRDADAGDLSLQPLPPTSTHGRIDPPRLSNDVARAGFSFVRGPGSVARRRSFHAASAGHDDSRGSGSAGISTEPPRGHGVSTMDGLGRGAFSSWRGGAGAPLTLHLP